MLKILTLTLTLLYQYTSSSIVIDSHNQQGIYLSDYCPKMESCLEGSHVMCMYYNPNHVMGLRCSKSKNVSITPELAETLLDVTNLIRSKIAMGMEKGKGGELLPKGYGMAKLKWDSELATFAQVLANQCVLKHDLCRATKRFPNPGQTAGLIRFTVPDWMPVTHAAHQFTKPGLTMSKLTFALTQGVNSWYRQRRDVSPSMVEHYPEDERWSQSGSGRLYLEMIYGSATHMGCGVSAYREYAYHDRNTALNYNSVQLICNFSSRPRPGTGVYQVERPHNSSPRCGCPPGFLESPECLCYENEEQDLSAAMSEPSCPGPGTCKPSVVLLPIFTVENAPPEKLIGRSRLHYSKNDEEEIPDLYTDNKTSTLPPMDSVEFLLGSIKSKKSAQLGYSFAKKEPHSIMSNFVKNANNNMDFKTSTPKKPYDVQKRIFEKYSQPQTRYNNLNSVYRRNMLQPKRGSIFGKIETFHLPKAGENHIPDVQPRRDFTEVKNLMHDYLNFRRDHADPFEHNEEGLYFKTTTERFLHSAEEKVMKYNNLHNISRGHQFNNHANGMYAYDNYNKDKSNDKLMTLLDKLEQEVKHIELNKNKKDLLDAKLRKIYGTVLGESKLVTYKTDRELDFTDAELFDFDKYEEKHFGRTNHVKKPLIMDEVEELEKSVEKIKDRFSDVENGIRPTARTHNIKHYPDHRSTKKTKNMYRSDGPHILNDLENVKVNMHRTVFSANNIKDDVFGDTDFYSDTDDDTKIRNKVRRKLLDEKDPLSRERRLYYQTKLENLERKLHNTKHHKDANNRLIRPVLPTRQEQPLRATKNQPDTFYMPDRARFLHGF